MTEFVFGSRYEVGRYGQAIKYKEALLKHVKDPGGWVDFLTGVPYGCIEMMVIVGEVTTKEADWTILIGGDVVAPVPTEFFDSIYKETKTMYSYVWLDSEQGEVFVDGIESEPHPKAPYWWHRINLIKTKKWPYPGEFLGLAIRFMPNLPWAITKSGVQLSSPYLFSGNWMDTVFVTSARIIECIINHDGSQSLLVEWRGNKFIVNTTDFAEYRAGERVTILKDISVTKETQLWKDDDTHIYNPTVWRVVPLMYYDKIFER